MYSDCTVCFIKIVNEKKNVKENVFGMANVRFLGNTFFSLQQIQGRLYFRKFSAARRNTVETEYTTLKI